MKKPKVLVVYKESAYSRYLSSRKLRGVLRRGGYLKVMMGSHKRHHATLRTVLSTLKAGGFQPEMLRRDQVHRLRDVDGKYRLVVTVGGDGTLLDASHYVGKTPVLGVNSDPSRSVARFSGCAGEGFHRTLSALLRGELRPVRVARLEFSVNGKKGKWRVLNDLLVTTASPAGTSRYILQVGRRAEEQLSSGVWISTAAGSTAASLSAGGKALPVSDRGFQYVVREAYHRKFGPRKLLKGVLPSGAVLGMTSRMKEGKVFVDGAALSLPFRMGDRLRVWASKEPLNLIGLRR
jgi:NAD+ kinase